MILNTIIEQVASFNRWLIAIHIYYNTINRHVKTINNTLIVINGQINGIK